MFDRRIHILKALRKLSAFTGKGRGTSRFRVIRSFTYSYGVYRRHFSDHLRQIETRWLEMLFKMFKGIEWPSPDENKLLNSDVKETKFWVDLRKISTQAALDLEQLPPLPEESQIKTLPLRVVYYTENRIDNWPPKEELKENKSGLSENDRKWVRLRENLQAVLEKYGPTGPDDEATPHYFWLVDDQWNDERYHYIEVISRRVLTLNWLKDVTDVLKKYPGWGVGVMNLTKAYLLIFADRLLVTGKAFRKCKDATSVLRVAKTLISTSPR